jgi:hypothetical protein
MSSMGAKNPGELIQRGKQPSEDIEMTEQNE